MRIVVPKSFSLDKVVPLITDFRESHSETGEILFDLSELEYVDSGTVNYLLLFPLWFRSEQKPVRIVLNSGTENYRYLKQVGIIEELEKHFSISDFNQPKELQPADWRSKQAIFQERLFDMLSSNPYLRTYLANSDYNRQLLQILSKDYKTHLQTSPVNEEKVYICLRELIDNVFQHSEQNIGAISIHFYQNNRIPFLSIAVTDLGIGFKKSLLKSERFAGQESLFDGDFIQNALKMQVSATDQAGRGLGLPTVAKYADRLGITSGKGQVLIFNDVLPEQGKGIPKVRSMREDLPGANVFCSVRLENESVVLKK